MNAMHSIKSSGWAPYNKHLSSHHSLKMGTRQTIRRSSEMARVSSFTSSSSLWMLVVMAFASTTTFSHAAWTLTPVASRSVWRETRSQNLLYRTAAAAPRRRRRLQMTPDSDIAAPQDDEDWRDFRARLVALERKHFSDVVDTNSCYVYEMGHVIEEGSVILSRHEHDFCYGLKQQYFHTRASCWCWNMRKLS
jgi:hypothetical protein